MLKKVMKNIRNYSQIAVALISKVLTTVQSVCEDQCPWDSSFTDYATKTSYNFFAPVGRNCEWRGAGIFIARNPVKKRIIGFLWRCSENCVYV